ncbi:MAG TPA: alpha/beta hydrolase [Candidatus Hydrogenedens sp.]|nr:alpha/beta hydrolase [Candidatus Hydrogenedens sp.]HOL19872.1 alpha/beta hydrolase [Candidatus Hydrogenedens sp.]HPP59795.1 alpha/beta hydrolase [Candidatus Hydrogenedens sp.]
MYTFSLFAKYIFPNILYQRTSYIYRTPAYYNWKYEDIFATVDKGKTHGWYIPVEGSKGIVLFSHGNAGNIADRLESVGIFRKLGLSVLVYDYGGYGQSTGKPSEERCCNDALAMWRYLIEKKGYSPRNIILFGRSLGGAVTADLATKVGCAGVILESTFLSTIDVAKDVFSWFPERFAKRNEFCTKKKVKNIKSPVLVIHSPQDTIIKYYHGKKIFELLECEKEFLEITGDHNEGFIITGDKYINGLKNFVEKVLNSSV